MSRNKEINEYYANAEFTRCRVYQVPSLPGAEFTGCRVHYSRCRVHQVPGLPGAGFTSIRCRYPLILKLFKKLLTLRSEKCIIPHFVLSARNANGMKSLKINSLHLKTIGKKLNNSRSPRSVLSVTIINKHIPTNL